LKAWAGAILPFTLTLMLSHIESLIDKIMDWFSINVFHFLEVKFGKDGDICRIIHIMMTYVYNIMLCEEVPLQQ
jgi:hypothetical protein